MLAMSCARGKVAESNKLVAACRPAPPAFIAWSNLGLGTNNIALGFWMDRERYDPLDAVGGAYLAIRLAGVTGLKQPRLVLTLNQGNKKLITQDLPADFKTQAPGDIAGFAIDINLRNIPVGDGYSIEAALFDNDKKIAQVAPWLFHKVKCDRPAAKGRVGVRVLNPNAGIANDEPVFFGVPLPKGALNSADHVRIVDAAGDEMPAQIDVSSRWGRVGSARWLGARFIARHEEGQREKPYFLEYGPGVKRAKAPVSPVRLEEAKDKIIIAAGPMQVVVPKLTGQVIEAVYVDRNGDGKFDEAERVALAGKDGGPYLVDDNSNRYAAVADAKPSIVIEECGPVRAVVRIESWYVGQGGEKLCKHITRLRVYAGQRRVDLSHSWLMTAHTPEARLADIGFALDVPEAKYLAFAGDNNQDLYTEAISPDTLRYILQDRWNHFGIHMNYQMSSYFDPKRRSLRKMRMVDEGAYSEGFGALRSEKAVVAVGGEDFWQNYPKEISAVGRRLTFHVWPGHGVDSNREVMPDEVNNLYWLHESRLLNFSVPTEVSNLPEKNWHTSKYFLHFSRNADAMGVMKTHEIKWLFADAVLDNAALRSQMRGALAAPVAIVDPKAMVDSGVFGPITVRDPKKDPEIEQMLDLALRADDHLEKMNRTYGMFIFGGEYTSYDTIEQRYDIYRAWCSQHHGVPRTAWLLYARSGDPFFFRRGLRNTRDVMDLGMCHYVRIEPKPGEFDGWQSKTVGGLHDYKGLVPWNAGGRAGDYNSMTDFMLYFTYMTGDGRGRETALKWWDGVLRWTGPGGSSRSTAGTMAAAIELYQDTWDYRMIPFIHAEFAGQCTGQTRFKYFNEWQNYASWLEQYWWLTGRAAARKVLVDWADAFVEGYGGISSKWGEKGINILAAAALASGNAEYLRSANQVARVQALTTCVDSNSLYYGMAWHGTSSSQMNYLLQRLPYVLGARERMGDVGRREGFFGISSTAGTNEHVLTWWMLDEKDESISMIFSVGTTNTSLHLSVFDPDGKVAAECDIPCDQDHPHGYPTARPMLRYSLKPDGKKGIYRCTVSARGRFGMIAPMAKDPNIKEVYPVADNTVSVGSGQVAFEVPANSGKYTINGYAGCAQSIHLLDEQENILAASETYRDSAWGGPGARFQVEIDSAVHHRFYGMAPYSGSATFKVAGKSPPKYCAVSVKRLFNPDNKEGAK